SFEDVAALIRRHRDVKLLLEVEHSLHLVSYTPGRITFRPADDAPADLAQRLGARLQGWTGARWAVSVTTAEPGAQTIAQILAAEARELEAQAQKHPLVQAVMTTFPGAKITHIRTRETMAQDAAHEALPEIPEADDTWDPFEDD
ncbi:MAG: DNA polymerase III subunit gamma/tau, partial [Rhodobacteraceae bacterium]|nr:DNA polymerase III subunit gamma/tau [Paracoccaceae bacterium]